MFWKAKPENNWVLHYFHTRGHMPAGWELVFGRPHYTGGKVPSERAAPKRRKLAATAVNPPLKEATTSPDVNPPIRDVGRLPVPVGGTSKLRYTPFRVNLSSGNRLERHYETATSDCGVYDPTCRDLPWEAPTWIGGTDWVTSPLYRHPPPSAKATFAQDPSGRNRSDTVLPGAGRDDSLSLGEAIQVLRSLRENEPIGLVSKVASPIASAMKKYWLSLSQLGASGSSAPTGSPKPSGFMAKRNKKRKASDSDDDTPKVYSTKHAPGSPEHAAALYRQAIELRRQTGKTMYIVDYNGRMWVTAKPQAHGKVVQIVEATTSANLAPFFGRRGLASIEQAKRGRESRQKSSKCVGYDPKCRDAEWDVPAAVGGALPLLRRQPLS